jgi:hypothetical protein
MIIYISQHLPTGDLATLEGKREANNLVKHPDFRVWEIEGRKGPQLNGKLRAFYDSVGNNELPPPWAASYYFPQKQKRIRTPEHNEKIKKALAGKPKSEEHKQAISEAMLGNSNRSKS